MSPTHVVILAAGQGTRMKSALPKVLHPVAGRPMVEQVVRTANSLAPASIIVVVGHRADAVQALLGGREGINFALQAPQLGTAHALQQAEPMLAGRTGTVVLLSGDVPLLKAATLRRLLETHLNAKAAATVVTASVERPYGYGRIIRVGGRIARIVEERDASPTQKRVKEINSGIYAFDLAPLFDQLRNIAAKNAQGEYYLTDLVALYRRRKLVLETVTVDDAAEIRGINTRSELAEVSAIMRQNKNEELMAAGVTIVDPATTYIDADVEVGPDTVIHPELANKVTINNFCLIVGARVADGAAIGPFAHLRPSCDIGPGAKIGNFVELKKTTMGRGSKANHLTYLGDTTLGPDVNVGAGTITCNYDGRQKHQTVIEEGAFIGSDSQLIAPVTIGRGAYVGSGTTVREDVPPGALAVSAGKQRNIEGWVERKKSEA
jgi:bifunctional UDP-N-acetylglucosamine pyrophosphorylase/glucosamine-1-phosphate N-acetyltransferase